MIRSESDIAAIVTSKAAQVSRWEFQQTHEELASLLHYVSADGPRENYLEIGVGSGAVASVVCEVLGIPDLYVIDDGYYDFSEAGRRKWISAATEWIGDSTSNACRTAVAEWDVKFQFVLVDGGHTYRECKSDTMLVIPHLADGAFVAFHDKGWAYDGADGQPDQGVKGWLADLQDGAVPGLVEEIWRSGNTALYRYTRPT